MSRIGQADLARALGLSQATVSLALRGNPRIPAETRERVEAEAERMGYRFDPLVSALADYRHRKQAPGVHGNVALLSSNPMVRAGDGERLCAPGTLVVRHLDAMIEVAARRHGYNIELCAVGLTAKEQRAACRALRARGVIGVLITVGNVAAVDWDFDWGSFSVVDISGIGRPQVFPSVANHHLESMFTILDELKARGYRRPGLWLDKWFDRVPAWVPMRAGFALRARELFGAVAEQTRDDDDMVEWLRRHGCDSLITFGKPHQLTMLRNAGISVPDGLGVVGVDVEHGREVTGIAQDFTGVGRNAVALLDGLIRQGVRGRQAQPVELLVSSGWREGETLRARPGAARSGGRARKSPAE